MRRRAPTARPPPPAPARSSNSAPRDHLDPGLPNAEPTASAALTDGEGGASGGRGGAAQSGGCWRPADRAGAGAGPGGKGFANTQGLTGGETHRHGGLTAKGTTGLGGRSPGDGSTGGPAALPALRASLPPWRVGGQPAQAPRRRQRRRRQGWRRRRRQSHGLLLWRGRAAPTDSRPLGRARSCSEAFGSDRPLSIRLGAWLVSPTPHPPAQVASGFRGRGFGNGRDPPDVAGSGPYPERMRRPATRPPSLCGGRSG